MRIETSICFLNVSFLDRIFDKIFSNSEVRIIVFDWSPVNTIDVTGSHAVKKIIEKGKKRKILFLHSQIKIQVLEELESCDVKLDKLACFWDLSDAFTFAQKKLEEITFKERDQPVLIKKETVVKKSNLIQRLKNPKLQEKACIIF